MIKKLMMLSAVFAIAIASCTKPTTTSPTGNGGTNGEKTGNKNDSTGKPPYNIEEGCGDTTPLDCSGVYCTQEVRMLFLDVKNSAGATVMLTSFHTEDMAGNKLPADLYGYDKWRDAYMVFNDSWVNGHEGTRKKVRFVGYVGSNKVVDEVYTIVTDCCHIEKTAGKDSVVLP